MNAELIKKEYINWLKDNISLQKINETTMRESLPYLDRNNDYIDIYIEQCGNDKYIITDGGEIIESLEFDGYKINDNRKIALQYIVKTYGVSYNENKNELFVETSLEDMPIRKHLLSQCMLRVNDMYTAPHSSLKSMFFDEVKVFLDENRIRYIPDFSLLGKSQLQANYEFVISKTENATERFIKVINNMSADMARNIIFSWTDTVQQRREATNLYTIISDIDKKVPEKAISALNEYDIQTILWSERKKFIDKLAA